MNKQSDQIWPRAFSRIGDPVWICLIALAPLIVLAVPGREYGVDWQSHRWFASYFGEYFKQHHAFPDVINTEELSGMPIPIFYGFLLYPVLGLVSIVTGPDIALRLALFGALLVQSREVFRILLQVCKDRALSLATTAVTAWSTYALTNLYNRGALNEFIAIALLTGSLCAIIRHVLLAPEERTATTLVSGTLFFALAAGAHPITALFGGIFLAFAVSVFLIFARERARVLRLLAIGMIATAIVLSPWFYVVAKFSSSLNISKERDVEITYYPEDLDSLSSRFMPVPYDARMARGEQVPYYLSPYLDTQITSSLLLLALALTAWVVSKSQREASVERNSFLQLAFFWSAFLVLLALSVTPAFGSKMPAIFKHLQLAYRLVSYLNLCLLLVVIVAGTMIVKAQSEISSTARRWLFPATAALAVLGLVIKLNHTGAAIIAPPAHATSSEDGLLHWPDTFYAAPAYAITDDDGKNIPETKTLILPLGRKSHFAEVQSWSVQVINPQNVKIAIQPFPWNQILMDGRPLSAAGTRRDPYGTICYFTAGPHEVSYAWRPDPLWQSLKITSRAIALLWLLLAIALGCRRFRWFPVMKRAQSASSQISSGAIQFGESRST